MEGRSELNSAASPLNLVAEESQRRPLHSCVEPAFENESARVELFQHGDLLRVVALTFRKLGVLAPGLQAALQTIDLGRHE